MEPMTVQSAPCISAERQPMSSHVMLEGKKKKHNCESYFFGLYVF